MNRESLTEPVPTAKPRRNAKIAKFVKQSTSARSLFNSIAKGFLARLADLGGLAVSGGTGPDLIVD